ncbi:MAG TPA: DEAD/DEAH box helicase [Thermoanaerobaculia bacterium]|jgi:ATP-dependent RNA helicase RhlE|nr:DEAD/DEAH box helicase [Thermoanaerobaculia bacterium]
MPRKTYQLTVHQIPSELANALQKEQTRSGRPLNELILELLRRGLENLPAPQPDTKPVAELKPEPKAKAAEPKPEPKLEPEPKPARKDRAAEEEEDEEEPHLFRDAHQSIAIPQHPVQTIDKPFDSLGLSPRILRIVKRIGFEHPTPIQAEVIPVALSGRDVVGLAQTGSGKTAAFCLPLAERLTHGGGVRGLIISPTREIALQTEAFLNLFGEDLETVCLIGGVKMGPQIRKLGKKPDVVVATPGRLLDHVERGLLRLDKVQELVIDEADHMLDMGFMPQVQRILDELPRERQTMMFSATMPPPIQRLAERILTDPVRIDILPEGGAAEGIDHRLYLVEPDDKKACLLALLNKELGSTLVFIRRKVDAEWLTRVLVREGHPVERIHSDLSQGQRVEALRGFREGAHRILVATDIAARGIDVPGIQHIVNFDIPDTVEDYIHRAGRTARGTARGIVSTIASWMNKPTIKEIEEALGEEIARCTVPGVEPYVEIKPRTSMSKGRRTLKVKRR